LVNYAYATGDVEPVDAASGGECETCANFVHSIEQQYSGGGSFEGGLITVLDAVAPEPDPSAPALVTGRYSQSAIRAHDSGGQVETKEAEKPSVTVAFYVERRGEEWVAFEIGGQRES
jgi:hypothetical protein